MHLADENPSRRNAGGTSEFGVVADDWGRPRVGLSLAESEHILAMVPADREDWYAFLILTGWARFALLDPDDTESD